MTAEVNSQPQSLLGSLLEVGTRPNVRQAVKLTLDAGLAAVAWVAATSLVLGALPTFSSVLIWVAFAMVVNVAFQHTRQHYRLMGYLELRSLLLSMLALVLVPAGLFLLDRQVGLGIQHPNVILCGGLLTVLNWVGIRAASVDYFKHRYLKKRPHRPTTDRRKTLRHGSSANDLALRTLIVGAGQAGAQLCQELQSNPNMRSRVVGFVDDALEKQGVRIQGVPVLGTSELLPTIIKESGATQVILAIPSAPGSRIRALAKILRSQDVRVKTLPSMQSLLSKEGGKQELRDIAIEDLLRRDPITLDLDSIHQALENSVVLITGAGGSIGSELARQVAQFNPSRLILLGRGENSLWHVERSLRRQFPELVLEVELCDIRNANRLQQTFETWCPQFVFHAAAHKHVPYLERHPEEGIENNIFGTMNVLKAAKAIGVKKFVNISTDKAVNPTSVLGATKRIAEFLVLRASEEEGEEGQYVSVRFGNVLGSRGSVIPLFHDQIRHGGPLTVTHPDMTRYFMTIPEASQLVLQAGILGQSGKVFVLDMGEPVHIVDLATDMAILSGMTPGFDIDINFSGIRPGEKLFEELFMENEQRPSDVHAKVFEAVPETRSRKVLERVLRSMREALTLPDGMLRRQAILNGFMELVPAYNPSPSGLGRYLSAAPTPTLETQDPGEELNPEGVVPSKIVVLRPNYPFAQAES